MHGGALQWHYRAPAGAVFGLVCCWGWRVSPHCIHDIEPRNYRTWGSHMLQKGQKLLTLGEQARRPSEFAPTVGGKGNNKITHRALPFPPKMRAWIMRGCADRPFQVGRFWHSDERVAISNGRDPTVSDGSFSLQSKERTHTRIWTAELCVASGHEKVCLLPAIAIDCSLGWTADEEVVVGG